MSTRPARRLAAALLNLLFLLAWGEPALLPPCPAHDAVAAMLPTSAASAHAPAGMAMGGAPGRDRAAASHGDEAGHACRCIGQCCPTAAIATPAPQAVRWQVVVRRLAAPTTDGPAAPMAATARLLPFANGPPRTA